MAETTKLSVGQALDKLRGTDAPKTKMTQLDEKISTLDEETQRSRAMTRRIRPAPSTILALLDREHALDRSQIGAHAFDL